MGDQIEFPKNYGTYMHHAMTELQQGNYEKAIEHLRKAYAIKEENSLNVLLVSALFHNGQVQEALELAEDKKSFYTTNDKRILVYVELLIHNHQFLLAQKCIDDKLKEPSLQYEDNWKTLQSTLYDMKEEEEKKRKAMEEKRTKQLFSLASASPEEQFTIIQEAHAMKTENLEKAAPSVFQNPYVHPISRSGFLSLLISRKVDQEYTYTWFNETKVVNPIDVHAFEQDPAVLNLMHQTNELYDQNPSLKELVENELNMILLLLYPFITEVIDEQVTKDWIRVIACSIDSSEGDLETIDRKQVEFIQSWINKIHQEFQ
ncbi:MAG: tetratricopeptide repeat protein [Alkalibacterium sp.]|nr:tetratricopeptide repeat protein [Alkalibacterium sp.]